MLWDTARFHALQPVALSPSSPVPEQALRVLPFQVLLCAPAARRKKLLPSSLFRFRVSSQAHHQLFFLHGRLARSSEMGS